jgi:hypothetical protein
VWRRHELVELAVLGTVVSCQPCFADQGVTGEDPVFSRELDASLERRACELLVGIPGVVEGAVRASRRECLVPRARRGIDAALRDHEVTPEGADARCNGDAPFGGRTRGHEMYLFVLALELDHESLLSVDPRHEHLVDVLLKGSSIARSPSLTLPELQRREGRIGARREWRRLGRSSKARQWSHRATANEVRSFKRSAGYGVVGSLNAPRACFSARQRTNPSEGFWGSPGCQCLLELLFGSWRIVQLGTCHAEQRLPSDARAVVGWLIGAPQDLDRSAPLLLLD